MVLLIEDGVHGLGALGDHRLELVPVDLLGDRRAGVPDEISDGLDGTPLSLMIGTNECRSSRGVQFSPSSAFLVIALHLTAAEWTEFLEAAQRGDFDELIRPDGTT